MLPLIRIFLRYFAGALVMWGLISTDMGATLADDPDVLHVLALTVSAIAAFVTEYWYRLAKRYGWRT